MSKILFDNGRTPTVMSIGWFIFALLGVLLGWSDALIMGGIILGFVTSVDECEYYAARMSDEEVAAMEADLKSGNQKTEKRKW